MRWLSRNGTFSNRMSQHCLRHNISHLPLPNFFKRPLQMGRSVLLPMERNTCSNRLCNCMPLITKCWTMSSMRCTCITCFRILCAYFSNCRKGAFDYAEFVSTDWSGRMVGITDATGWSQWCSESCCAAVERAGFVFRFLGADELGLYEGVVGWLTSLCNLIVLTIFYYWDFMRELSDDWPVYVIW